MKLDRLPNEPTHHRPTCIAVAIVAVLAAIAWFRSYVWLRIAAIDCCDWHEDGGE